MLLEREIKKFFEKVNKNAKGGCWEWTRGCFKCGYGKVIITRIPKLTRYAHRISYMQYKGEIPQGLFVLHTCDNRKCVNPEHLFLGTHQDNMDDMKNKKRKPNMKGEHNYNARLTKRMVKEIASLLASKNNIEIANIYGVSHSLISLIRLGKNWSSVTGIKLGDNKKYESMAK